ncbi:hypothetical protein V8C86DRAFT_3013104 [Haematococcus lacustris]
MDSPILILYGSQSGNAQDVAERMAREARFMRLMPRCMAMDAYDVSRLPSEQLALLVTSTTGQGDVPDNMRSFWRFLLRKSLPPDSLSGLRCAVFGLGDSGYAKYNVAAKKLLRRLEGLGAKLLLPLGLGDDQHANGYEAGLDSWLAALWPLARRAAGCLPEGVPLPVLTEASQLQLGQPRFHITLLPPATAPAAAVSNSSLTWPNDTPPATSASGSRAEDRAAGKEQQQAGREGISLPANGAPPVGYETQPATASQSEAGRAVQASQERPGSQRVTAASHFQDTRLLELQLEEGVTYEPGDVLAVLPRPPGSAVDALLERLQLDGEQVDHARAKPCLQGAIDISGASPRRYFFQVLHHFASEEREKERLAYFGSPEGREDLYRYNQREGRTLLEVLMDFPSARLPLAWLLEAAPPLRPRYFSIASSIRCCGAHPHEAHLLVALVEWRTPCQRIRRGLCSSYLAAAQLGEEVACWVQRGALRMPADRRLPLLLIGPGTGVAPFRAFLEERQPPAPGLAVPGSPAPCHLFFGCRSASSDFYFQHQWQQLQQQGVLAPAPLGLVTAFSRDQGKKVYVSHKLMEHGADVWGLLEQGALVYVAGSAKNMPQGVLGALEGIAQQHGGLSLEAATQFMKQLELKGRYWVEAWS